MPKERFSAALLISLMGIAAKQINFGTDILAAQGPTVIKAGAPVLFTDGNGPIVR